LFLALLNWLQYQLAYAFSFGLGVVISYSLNRWFVFRGSIRRLTGLVFPLIPLGQWIITSVWLELIVRAGVEPALALALAIVLAYPFVFLASRMLFVSR